jgi:hypothetical protein
MKFFYCVGFFISHLLLPYTAISQTDQELVWGSYFGGSSSNNVLDFRKLDDGGFLIVGRTESSSGVATASSHQSVYGGSQDAFLAKFDENKSLLWCTYFGGSQQDVIFSIGLSVEQKIIVAGSTVSSNNIATPGSFIENITGFENGFIASFSVNGELEWSTYIGGTTGFYDLLNTLVITDNGDIIVAGLALSDDFPVTIGSMQENYGGGNSDGIICRFSPSGQLIWSSYFGNEGTDRITSIAIDNQGNILGLGETTSQNGMATNNANQTALSGDKDLFLFKMAPNGSLIWSTYFGGIDEEGSPGRSNLVIDENNNLYIAGKTSSAQGITTAGSHQVNLIESTGPLGNMMLASFNPNGEQLWGSYFGSRSLNVPLSLRIVDNSLIVMGRAFLDEFISAGNPMYNEVNDVSSGDAFLASFSLDGTTQQWGTFFGGNGGTYSNCLEVMSSNQVVIAGSTESSINISTPDGFRPNKIAEFDAFIAFFQINYGTGVNENEVLPMSVFPNPTTGNIRLQLPPSFSFNADVQVFDLTGRLVKNQQNFNSFDYLNLNVPTGMYVISCRNGEKVARTKVVVE